eukprot:CAMPEP_0184859334 /NCGR_PEP_ID=MMETSP0580-20130426/4341_1 /TAXON_ID=1118495 /ORGANISM="Dactyliosolen fragilissimus" /LENGTH=71 /DNA_ID=CAMNT_0027355915 /DNA_START=1223 /DNA_END=1438 /DNA_ORIENTATION=+
MVAMFMRIFLATFWTWITFKWESLLRCTAPITTGLADIVVVGVSIVSNNIVSKFNLLPIDDFDLRKKEGKG